jgi:hypothetical protein
MSLFIHKLNEALYRCWKEAMRRNLLVRPVDDATFEVSSFI